MAEKPKTDNPPAQAEPVIISAPNIKNAQTEKMEKERKDLLQKQLKQGVVDDKNSKNLIKTLVQIGTVLKGVVPGKNGKLPGAAGKPDEVKTIGGIIKGALKDVVKGKTDSIKSLVSVKGLVGMAAAKYAGDPTSIMGSVFSRVHEHLDDKDKAEQEKNDFRKGFAGGTDIGRDMFAKIKEEKLKKLKEANNKLPREKQKSDTDLESDADKAALGDEKYKKDVDAIFEEKKKLESELADLKAKANTLKSEGGKVDGKDVFTLSKEEQDRIKKINSDLGKITRGGNLKKEPDEVVVPKTDIDQAAIAEAEERDEAMKVFRKNNDIEGDITPQQEKQFEHELKQNKEAKTRARDENNKTQLANESVQKAMDDGAFEKMRPEVKERAEKLGKDNDAQANISDEDLDKAKEDYYSNMFKDIMEELNTLSKDQLEELHAIRTAIEGDNKKDEKREAKLDDKADDHLSKIQKLDVDNPDLINQNALLAGKPILGESKIGGKDGEPEKDEKSGGILDQLSDLFGGKNKKTKPGGKAGGLWKKAGRFLRGAGGGALALGAAAPAALYGATELAQWAQDNPQEALEHIPGAPEKSQADMSEVEKIKDEGSSFLGIKSSAYSAHEKKWKNRAEQGTQVSPEVAAAVKEKYGIDLQIEKATVPEPEPAPEKPTVTPTKEIIDEKQDAVDQAREEKKTPPPSIVNAPTVNNKTTNNNTTITREPIRAEDPNLPWRSAIFNG